MFLSLVHVNIGKDPDRPNPGRGWLRNVYRVHQRLCMAFPSESRKVNDPDFLAPFVTEDFGHKQVRVPRGKENGFLFRIDPSERGEVAILVQSSVEPDWDYAFHNAGHFLASPTEVKQVDASFQNRQSFRFRLMANPTRKIDTKSSPDGSRRNGRRIPVHADQLFSWLSRKSEASGFVVSEGTTAIEPGYIYFRKSRTEDNEKALLRSVRYDGLLEVSDRDKFHVTLCTGLGPGKSMGFGLLSIAAAASN
ncbi:MAG: type I-E CRISPR-associated protein Cas6/Cse3/CasE [Chloroflexi bacterium]|nr:type I-E CRISPR-associated protein Cas6/Cse3/CasE [Chloroflexota bacterium]